MTSRGPSEALLVAAGAGLGALARLLVTTLVPTSGALAEFVVVLVVNILGCFAMGVLRPGPFLGVGFLGGFTTFSTVSLLSAQSSAPVALLFVAASFSGCVGAWLVGDSLRGREP